MKYFSDKDNFGDLSKMDVGFLNMLDNIRDEYGLPFIIHCGWEIKGHADNSGHGFGKAVDFHIKDNKRNIKEQWLMLVVCITKLGYYDCAELGVYPYWNNPGFHLGKSDRAKRWGRDITGKYVGALVLLNNLV